MNEFILELEEALGALRELLYELQELELNNELLSTHSDEIEEALEILFDEVRSLRDEIYEED